MRGSGTACRTARMDDKDRLKGQGRDAHIAPCPSCGELVVRKRIGGSVKRFCSDGCRWAWHRQERRQKLIEEIEAAACSMCREVVLKVIRKGDGGMGL